jgi:hypothetical protein
MKIVENTPGFHGGELDDARTQTSLLVSALTTVQKFVPNILMVQVGQKSQEICSPDILLFNPRYTHYFRRVFAFDTRDPCKLIVTKICKRFIAR